VDDDRVMSFDDWCKLNGFLISDAAILASLALQCGCPLTFQKIGRTDMRKLLALLIVAALTFAPLHIGGTAIRQRPY
jgi:hypothetical protein